MSMRDDSFLLHLIFLLIVLTLDFQIENSLFFFCSKKYFVKGFLSFCLKKEGFVLFCVKRLICQKLIYNLKWQGFKVQW